MRLASDEILGDGENDAVVSAFAKVFVFMLLLANALLSQYLVIVLSGIYIIHYFFTSRLVIPRGIIEYLTIPSLLILIGMSGSLGHMPYDVLKDGWYYLNPVLVLCSGYLLMHKERQLEAFLKVFVVTGFLLSLLHIFEVLSRPELLIDASVNKLREETKAGYFVSMMSLAIMLYTRKFNIVLFESQLSKLMIPAIILADAISLIISFSRTMWLSFIVTAIAGAGLFTLKRLKSLVVLLVLTVALFSIVNSVTPQNLRSYETMVGRIVNSLDELIIGDYVSKKDLNSHWRGYETYMAIKTYMSGSALNLIMGHGFGALVDLNIYMQLGESTSRFIPVLHNGYMNLLVKTGVVGLLLYIAYISMFLRTGLKYSTHSDSHVVFAGRFIVASSLVLFLTTFVIAGMLNKSTLIPIMLILGMLLAYLRDRFMSTGGRKNDDPH